MNKPTGWISGFAEYARAARRTISGIVQRVWRPKLLLLVSGGSLALAAGIYTVVFFYPRSVVFSYSQPNCFVNPVLFPGLLHKTKSATFDATLTTSYSLGDFPIYSHTTCLHVVQPPKAGARETMTFAPAKQSWLKKSIIVTTTSPPALSTLTKIDAPIATTEPFAFKVSQKDLIFDYQLVVADKKIMCPENGTTLVCDLDPLQLEQSSTYDFALHRVFKGEPAETVFKKALTTVEAVHVTTSSIAPGATQYDKPTEVTITLNKPAKAFEGVRLQRINGDKREDIAIKPALDGTKLVLTFEGQLPRSAQLELTVEKLMAQDKAYLTEPYKLQFYTSGGPKVVGSNLKSTRASAQGPFTLTFDSNLLPSQTLQNFIKIEVGGNVVAANYTLKGRTITITPHASLGRCTAFSLRVLDGLQNTAGISGGSAWRQTSRTVCQEVFTIGRTVQGRSILAYKFGSGHSKIFFIGTMHGNEKSATSTLTSFIDELESNPGRIPSHRTIIVIPNLNADGYAANTRVNANNVDLNRNFPAANWKPGVTMPEGGYLEHGGGTTPLSEPESQIIANYVAGHNPRLVMSYHSKGGMAIENGAGDAHALATTYANMTGFWLLDNNSSSGAFDYDTTGSFEDWLREAHGTPAILIELATRSSNEFSGHKNAMWAMVNAP